CASCEPRVEVRFMQSVIIVLVVVLVLQIKSAKTASRTTTSTSTNRMTNKIGVPQPMFSPKKFLFPIRLDAHGQWRCLYEIISPMT
ncbi:MAG: hypothetical protein WCB15_24285, partial [Desulfobacterales bacterium]